MYDRQGASERSWKDAHLDEDKRLLLIGVGAYIVLFFVGLHFRFDDNLAAYLPPKPPKPKPAVDPKVVLRELDYKPEVFRGHLAKDADDYGIDRKTLEQFDDPFPYELVDARTPLDPGGPAFETQTLRLSARIGKAHANTERGSYSTEHLILRIENKTDRPLAYRVVTRPSASGGKCLEKGDLTHNALALRPREALERTECLWHKGMTFTITRVETMVLPPLSYYYVSRLDPVAVGLEERTARAHRPPDKEICVGMDGQAIRLGLERGRVSWRDVIDFHARHDCRKYLFPVGYRAFTRKGEYVLPVRADAFR